MKLVSLLKCFQRLKTIDSSNGETIDNDIDFMDLEAIDYNVSSLLDKLIRVKEDEK